MAFFHTLPKLGVYVPSVGTACVNNLNSIMFFDCVGASLVMLADVVSLFAVRLCLRLRRLEPDPSSKINLPVATFPSQLSEYPL